jgi:hypothetical protein
VAGYLDAPVALDHRDVELALQVQPELRVLPKWRPRRTAVSAVIDCLLFKMSVTRPGTSMSSANRLALSARALNSRFNNQPGCTAGSMAPILAQQKISRVRILSIDHRVKPGGDEVG